MNFKTIENSSLVYFVLKIVFLFFQSLLFVKQFVDPHGSAYILPPGSGSSFRKMLDPNSHKMNAHPQPWFETQFATPEN